MGDSLQDAEEQDAERDVDIKAMVIKKKSLYVINWKSQILERRELNSRDFHGLCT